MKPIEKPPHGSPCNNCGQCCMEELCPLAAMVFGSPVQRQCPALENDGERYICGLVAHPMVYAMRRTLQYGVDKMSEAAAFLVGAGRGCDAQLENEPANDAFRADMRAKANPRQADSALRLWGIKR